MKTIKLFTLLVITTIATSCLKFKPSQTGELSLKNGDDKKVLVKYEVAKFKYEIFVKQIKNKDELQNIAEQASEQAKLSCKFMPTYEPKSLSFMANYDTVTVFVSFNAKNAFGVAGSEVLISKFKGKKFIGNL